MDIISGSLLNQAFSPASLNQAFSPTLGPSAAPRGRSPVSSPVTEAGAPTPAIPDLFGRPTAGPVFQAPDPVTPPPPPPAPAPPAGPSPNVMNQALMLQNLLGGLGQTGLQPLFGMGGITDPVYGNPSAYGPFGGWGSGYYGGYGQSGNEWGTVPGAGTYGSTAGPYGTGIAWGGVPGHSPYQSQAATAWGGSPGAPGNLTYTAAMQQVLNSLAPELQGLSPIQSLFNAPLVGGFQGAPQSGLYTGGSGLGGGGGWQPTGINDPIVNAAIQALTQYIQGGGGGGGGA